ncbi:Alpha/Beta hydrolase protein [Zopfochytrium polystomum]|nr:Alpha/Beta hydrolase protein [Zopfochytrium polystomum]
MLRPVRPRSIVAITALIIVIIAIVGLTSFTAVAFSLGVAASSAAPQDAATAVIATSARQQPAGSSCSWGCGGGGTPIRAQEAPPTSFTRTFSIVVRGKRREYIVRVPLPYRRHQPHRLVIAYHWYGATASDVTANATSYGAGAFYGLEDVAQQSPTIFVAPNGLNGGWMNDDDEDMELTDLVVEAVADSLCVDRGQVFAVGFSFGGSMAYAVARSGRGALFRAVAILSGRVFTPWRTNTAESVPPVAAFVVHGVGDSINGIGEGRAMRDALAAMNGCKVGDNAGQESALVPGTHAVRMLTWCEAPVAFVAFDGDHVYDPRDARAASSWLPGEIWKFFDTC